MTCRERPRRDVRGPWRQRREARSEGFRFVPCVRARTQGTLAHHVCGRKAPAPSTFFVRRTIWQRSSGVSSTDRFVFVCLPSFSRESSGPASVTFKSAVHPEQRRAPARSGDPSFFRLPCWGAQGAVSLCVYHQPFRACDKFFSASHC